MARLTLSMIVKNEEKHLAGCLSSVKDVVDEIVIVDTGSVDKTIEIAKEYGARIFHFDWINDFSAARNFALSKSTGDWILYLDADERLSNSSVEELRKIVAVAEKSGYYCTVKSYDSEYGRDNQMSYVRLFSNSSDISFQGKVHEQILPSLIENNYKISSSNIVIEHIGYNIDNNQKKDKAKRNLELLLNEYNINKNPYNEFQLALTYQVLENYSEARKFFLLAAENKSFDNIYRAHSYTSLALIYSKEHKIKEAENFLTKSLSLRYNDPFTHLLASKIFLRKNELKKAIDHCNKADHFNNDLQNGKYKNEYSVFLSNEEIILTGLTIAKQLKDDVLLNNYYRKYIDYVYRSMSLNQEHIIIALEKLVQGNLLNEEEISCICNYASRQNLKLLIFLIKEYSGTTLIEILLKELQKLFPENIELTKSLAEYYVSINDQKRAAEIYQELADKKDDDPAVYFYLLSFYLGDGNIQAILSTINKIETEFHNIPEVIARINLIKQKLSGILVA